jgi:hypothetical protein
MMLQGGGGENGFQISAVNPSESGVNPFPQSLILCSFVADFLGQLRLMFVAQVRHVSAQPFDFLHECREPRWSVRADLLPRFFCVEVDDLRPRSFVQCRIRQRLFDLL